MWSFPKEKREDTGPPRNIALTEAQAIDLRGESAGLQ